MRPTRWKPGFALLLTLMLVLIAGAALTGLARRSILRAVASEEAVGELQRRWAVTSCRATFLGHVEKLLDAAEKGPRPGGGTGGPNPTGYARPPMPALHVSCRLAGTDYELVFTDEQAKVNVNELLDARGLADAQRIARSVVRQSAAGVARRVSLRPRVAGSASDDGGSDRPEVAAYGQVFEDVSPGELLGGPGRAGAASALTCWGDGRVSFRRASPAVFRAACERALGGQMTAALLEARRRNPYASLRSVMSRLRGLGAGQKDRIAEHVTDRSRCHGLWVVARGRRRAWYTLAVSVSGGTGESRMFTW